MASEPPTRPLGPRPDPYRGGPVPPQPDLGEELRRSRSRATAGLVLALLALAAGAVAIVLALDDDSGGSSGRGVSRSSFSDLRQDVRSLENDVDELRQQGQQDGDGDVGQRIEDLDERLSQINDRQGQMSDQIQELQDRVDELESQPSPTPTPTP